MSPGKIEVKRKRGFTALDYLPLGPALGSDTALGRELVGHSELEWGRVVMGTNYKGGGHY